MPCAIPENKMPIDKKKTITNVMALALFGDLDKWRDRNRTNNLVGVFTDAAKKEEC